MTTASITFHEHIAHPVERVWQALTTPALIAKWWAAGDVRPQVGHKFTLDMGKWGEQPCEVLAVEAERLLRYSFAGTMTLTWRLEPSDGGTLLTLHHEGFDLESPLGQTAFAGMGKGWPTVLKGIADALADAEPADT